jgi:hypothetical protein
MLRRTLGDERETPTRSLRSIAVEEFAAVGRLTAVRDVVIENPTLQQLARGDAAKVQT